ncbi:MAG: sulfotransferase [Chloroflexota bacterium]|nr:sulfotransferase [Chloroflexota bacterium]
MNAEAAPEVGGGREPEAVFIVGVSRSGTTLMRSVLDSHPRLAVATENHYVGHLLDREGARHYFRRLGDLRQDATVRALVEFIWSGEFQRRSRLREISPYWRWLARTVPRETFEANLLASDRTDRGIFTAVMRTYADVTGKSLIGEKTPAHLGYVETLLEWYPDARVIHMIRDPRAIYVSELRRRTDRAVTVPYRQLVRIPFLFRIFVLNQVALTWAGALRRHRELERRFPDRYRLVRFEDLVTDPRATLQELVRFLGLGWDDALLDQKVVSKGSRRGERGFDAGAAWRWRERIGTPAGRWLKLLLGGRLREAGYLD